MSVESNVDPSGYVITIFSMLFTIVSIALGVFEYIFGAGFIASGSALVIQFNVETNYIAKMQHSTFKHQIIYKRRKLVECLTKELEIDRVHAVDRLVPIHTKKGVTYTFIIEGSNTKVRKTRENFYKTVNDNSLTKVC